MSTRVPTLIWIMLRWFERVIRIRYIYIFKHDYHRAFWQTSTKNSCVLSKDTRIHTTWIISALNSHYGTHRVTHDHIKIGLQCLNFYNNNDYHNTLGVLLHVVRILSCKCMPTMIFSLRIRAVAREILSRWLIWMRDYGSNVG